MGRKKIQKPAKENKAQDHQSDSEPKQEPEPIQQPNPPKVQSNHQNTKSAPKKRGPKPKEAQKTEKREANTPKKAESIQLFTEQFNQKVQNFKSFYQQYLNLKAGSSDVDASSEYNRVNNEVRLKIQKACLNVIKENINDAQKWIEEQQKTIRDQIANVQKVEQDTRKALESTGTFSIIQIDRQVQGIRDKKVTLEKSLNQYEQTKSRANQLYQSKSSMDQQ